MKFLSFLNVIFLISSSFKKKSTENTSEIQLLIELSFNFHFEIYHLSGGQSIPMSFFSSKSHFANIAVDRTDTIGTHFSAD